MKDIKFDYCIQVSGDKHIYLVDSTLQSKISIQHWNDYVKLGKPAINVVTQEEADCLKTVRAFGQTVAATAVSTQGKVAAKGIRKRSSATKKVIVDKSIVEESIVSSSVLVIIPTLNRPTMCWWAVTSLIWQEFTNWSLVIAKNGGTHVKEYLEALNGILTYPKITYLMLPKQGLGYALNKGVALREGHDYFAVLEDDDEWDPKFLSRLVAVGDSTQGDVIHCKQRQVPINRQGNGVPMVRKKMHKQNAINFPMCLFRTSLVERVGQFCNEAGPATDWDWHLRCIDAGAKYVFVPEVLVTHNWHDSNFCMSHSANDFIRERQEEGMYGACK